MANQRQGHRIPLKTARRLLAIVAVLCLAITFKSYRTMAVKHEVLQTNRKKIEERSKAIKKTGNDIRRSDDLDFAEEVAREDLGMVKPREVIYIDNDKDRKDDPQKEDNQ